MKFIAFDQLNSIQKFELLSSNLAIKSDFRLTKEQIVTLIEGIGIDVQHKISITNNSLTYKNNIQSVNNDFDVLLGSIQPCGTFSKNRVTAFRSYDDSKQKPALYVYVPEF